MLVKYRRLLLAIPLCMAAARVGVLAQHPDRVAVVGTLALGATQTTDSVYESMRKGLRDLGYSEGRDFKVQHRTAEGHADRLPALARELVALRVDVIVTGTDAATRAAKQATNTIPIVAVLPEHDPVASGLIDSFNRPGVQCHRPHCAQHPTGRQAAPTSQGDRTGTCARCDSV